MAQHSFIKISNDTLRPATPAAREYLHSKVKCGDVLYADFKKARNPRFHRKYFALLNLGYEYWEPTGGTISPEEKNLSVATYNFWLTSPAPKMPYNPLQMNTLPVYRKIVPRTLPPLNPLMRSDAGQRWNPVTMTLTKCPMAACIENPVQSVLPKWRTWNFRNSIKPH
ncbi:bacteriophage protein [Xenorhabdus mauleonii]|uniref:Bacteriophage protein n=1 Tax=Xenorhabdus mauleonii TaxID=351675 RepID=A0A1I3X3L7_9GAMM|nr:bacteriophage protein [Xenorhabdus mauleonii]SFK13909.1 Protein of unknown function [Xenorhabdus mauleonii]